jgi:hypothetical protein
MVIRLRGFEFIQEDFYLTVRFQGVVCLVACGFCLLEDSIDVQIFDGCMEVQLTFELPK